MATTLEVKETLIKTLNLEDLTPDDIADGMILFSDEGLGLDSVDAIEITLMLDKEFGVKVKNVEEAESIFASVQTLTDYINEQKQ